MENPVLAQALELILAITLGIVIGLIYDFCRIIRICMPSGTIYYAACDFVFWIVVIPVFFLFNLMFLNGNLRAYVFVGAFAGAICYFSSVSYIVLFFARKIIRYIKQKHKKFKEHFSNGKEETKEE